MFSKVILVTLLAITLAATNAHSTLREPIPIFYNGSIRGDLGTMTGGGQAETLTLLKRLRKVNENLISLCAGDVLGPSVTSDVDGGATIVKIMNMAQYDVCGVGAHDFSYGWQGFLDRVKEANFPFVCSNIYYKDKHPIELKDNVLIERGGNKVFVAGVTSATLPKRWPGWPIDLSVKSPVAALKAMEIEAKQADMVVVLSSMEFEENMNLLKRLPWIDVIISTLVVGNRLIDKTFRDVSLVNGRRLLWTFHSGLTVGLLRGLRSKKGFDSTLRLLDVLEEGEPDETAKELIFKLQQKTQTEMGECICNLNDEEFKELKTTLLEALRYELKAEIALIDQSSFRTRHADKCLTKNSIRQIYPFRSRGAVVILTGRQIKKLWEQRNEPIVWNRGLAILGMRESRGKLLINDRLLRNHLEYRVATSEYLALGSLDLLPRQPEAVKERGLSQIFIDHYSKYAEADRKKMYRRLSRRPIHRRKLNFDFSYERLYFSGSADQYQYRDPSAFGLGSDIPGLVGNPHDSFRFDLDADVVVDNVDFDETMRIDITYKTWKDSRSLDYAELTLRREATAVDDRPQVFGEYKLTGTVSRPDLADKRHPMFGKAVAGLVWRPTRHGKILAGLGNLTRFSQPDNPNSLGINFQHEFKKNMGNNIELSTLFDFFGSWDKDKVRTADVDLQLRFKITQNFSTVLKFRRYFWRDDIVDESAQRSEVYVGFGITRRLRRF